MQSGAALENGTPMAEHPTSADHIESAAAGSPLEGRIVGIGASAGGLESLEQLFSALPKDTGLAFVVVQHLSPDFRSLMDELIARHSEMPVVLAKNGMKVEANHIYLMPPRKEMMIRDRHLWLTEKEPHTFSLPIDAFFRSLAQDVGPQAVAIVLSGSGSDGSRGIVEVKRAGGLVLAESATTAKFDGMPLAAAATGAVEATHAPGDLARLLCGLPPLAAAGDDQILSEDPTMDAVLRLLRDNFGIDFSLYKMTTVGRRIQRRVELLRLPGLAEYVEYVIAEPEELNKLYQDLLIGVTQFFRDPEAFETIEREVIPRLVDHVKPEDELRVWIAGCATGEEAYSLAMLLCEAFTARGRAMRLKILATDVHQRSLDFAGVGIYGEEQLTRVSPERLERFFSKRSSGYQVSPELRQLIVFARHNVTKDPPFTRMHLVSCRNMLIYLQPQAQRSVLSLFHFGLLAGGILFLGASETPGVLSEEFSVVHEHWKVYRKRRDVHLLNQVRLPIQRTPSRRPVAPLDLPRTASVDPLVLATYDQLLDLFMPPGLLIDENGVLLDTFGGAEKLLKFKPRRPTSNALELLDDELRTVIGGAMQRAIKDRRSVSYSGVRIRAEADEVRRIVTVQPLIHPRTGAQNILITLREMANEETKPVEDVQPPPPLSQASRERLTTLEAELQYTRETLQATIEELETSNEEMQATNEELVASNEELQSTNEELHSVNEELFTVNAEYQQKISELKELNSDMAHLLEGTDVGTVFLDGELRIRRFTSRIASVFRFQQADIGRRIGDFSHNIERAQLMDEIADALHKGATVEDEVRDRSGTPYFLRILPYRILQRPTNGHVPHDSSIIEGVVLTLTDLSALESTRHALEEEQHKVRALLQRREEFLAMLSHELRNPLSAVLLAANLEEDEPTKVRRTREVITRQATHMKHLLDDLLDVSRITSDKLAIKRDSVDLRESIDTAIESTAPLFKARGTVLRAKVSARPLLVIGDARRLTQVIGNLLSNAAIYSPVGSSVTLTTQMDDDIVLVCVSDHGDGIDAAIQSKIFELFVQSEQALDRSRGGLGVGLSLAKAIVELHGGTIRVHSEGRGKGSTFEVRLPLAPVRPIVAVRGHTLHCAPCRIVLVDDQDDAREMLRGLLEARSHVVYDAADGAQAIQVISEHRPDVAFIDLGLPVMDGFAVAQQIRKRPELQGVKLVALTGYGRDTDIEFALHAGFDHHMTKPARLEDLEQILATARPAAHED